MTDNVILDTTADYIARTASSFELALTVEEAIQQVKKELLSRFWNELKESMWNRVESLDEEWRVEISKVLSNDPHKNYGGVYIFRKQTSDDAGQLRLGIWQEKQAVYLWLYKSIQSLIPLPPGPRDMG